MNKAKIFISGKIGEDTVLTDVIAQYKAVEDPELVDVNINSIGGSVEVGNAIYDFLDGLPVQVNTYATKAYSIASKIFLVGEERIVEDVDKALMVHFAWAKVQGTSEKIQAVADKLKDLEEDFATFYSEKIDIDVDTVKSLLEDETYLSGERAKSLGFATGIKEEILAVSTSELLINDKKIIEMSGKNKKLSSLIMGAISSVFGDEVNALELQDSNGETINFKDLEEGATPAVGDKGYIGETAVPDGTYIMPQLENASVVFVDGAISEIIPEEEAPADDAPADDVDAQATEVREIMSWSTEVVNTSFAEGDVVEYEYETETYPVGAGEYMLNDGRRIVTDASGVIVKIKEAVVEPAESTDPAPAEEVEASVSEQLAEGFKIMASQLKKQSDKDKATLLAEITTLKGQISSPEFVALQEEKGKAKKNKTLVEKLTTKA